MPSRSLIALAVVAGASCQKPFTAQVFPAGIEVALGARVDLAVVDGCEGEPALLIDERGVFTWDAGGTPPPCARSRIVGLDDFEFSPGGVLSPQASVVDGGVFILTARADAEGQTTFTAHGLNLLEAPFAAASSPITVTQLDDFRATVHCGAERIPAPTSVLVPGTDSLVIDFEVSAQGRPLAGYALDPFPAPSAAVTVAHSVRSAVVSFADAGTFTLASPLSTSFSVVVESVGPADFDDLEAQAADTSILKGATTVLSHSLRRGAQRPCHDRFERVVTVMSPSICSFNGLSTAPLRISGATPIQVKADATGTCVVELALTGSPLRRTVSFEITP